MIKWFKTLFKAKPAAADLRPSVVPPKVLWMPKADANQKFEAAMKTPIVSSRESAEKALAKIRAERAAPLSPSTGYQPSASRFAAPPAPVYVAPAPAPTHDGFSLSDAVLTGLVVNELFGDKHVKAPRETSQPASEIEMPKLWDTSDRAPEVKSSWSEPSTPAPAPAPEVRSSWTYDPPAAPAPVSYEPSYTSTESYSSSDSFSSSSFD